MSRSKSRTQSKKRVPPPRIRYEKSHPTVSIRISEEMRRKLAELKDEHGLSLGEVLRIGIQIAQPDLDYAYDRGLQEGYEIARAEYEVTFRCSRCGRRHLSITDEKTKEAASDFLYRAEWQNPACRG
jgi:hypothetical protein